MTALIDEFEHALLSMNRLAAKQIWNRSQLPPVQFVEDIVIPVLERVGTSWEQGTLALSQIYMCGRICEDLVNAILPPGSPLRKAQPRLAIAVLEDYHLLGKRIVYSVLRSSGFDLSDYGRVEVNELVRRVQADQVQVLLISTLMLPSALRVREVRRKLDEIGQPVKIVVGGAPFRFDEELWRQVGADAMGRHATEVVELVSHLTGGAA
jgi:methanogenic corrinoid protein MtbC1